LVFRDRRRAIGKGCCGVIPEKSSLGWSFTGELNRLCLALAEFG
jgi:hypothetical protein